MFPNIPNSFYDANTNIRGSSQLPTVHCWFQSKSTGHARDDLMVFYWARGFWQKFRTNKGWRANCGVSSVRNMRAVIFLVVTNVIIKLSKLCKYKIITNKFHFCNSNRSLKKTDNSLQIIITPGWSRLNTITPSQGIVWSVSVKLSLVGWSSSCLYNLVPDIEDVGVILTNI